MQKILLFSLSISLSTLLYAEDFTITSKNFINNAKIPAKYSCSTISPALHWQGTPNNTKSFALTVTDIDAPGGKFYHWLVYNISANTNSFPENRIPLDVKLGKNNYDQLSYNGPCPPKDKPHHYIFTIYALDTVLNLPIGVSGAQLEEAIKDHVLKKAELVGVFQK